MLRWHRSEEVRASGGAAGPSQGVTGATNCVIYADGHPIGWPATIEETCRWLRDDPDTMAWVGLPWADRRTLASLGVELSVHEQAMADAVGPHQRPKLARYGQTLLAVLRSARYLDESEEVEFGELQAIITPRLVATVQRGGYPDLSVTRRRVEARADLVRHGPEGVLYAILGTVVDAYGPVVDGLQNDTDEIESDVFRGDPHVSRRIYDLSREVIEFRRWARALAAMIGALTAGFVKYDVDEELQRYLLDLSDRVGHVVERADGLRQMLTDILTVNATLVSQRQSAEMKALTEASKRISSWAAILFAPTLIGTVYGMNFRNMPELAWEWGYPFALGLMIAVCATLFVMFRRRDWL